MIKKLLIGCGSIVLLVFCAFVALAFYTTFANRSADQAAAAFCGRIALQSDLAGAIAQADRDHVRHRAMDSGKHVEFMFQGGIFYANSCTLDVHQGKVIAVRSQVYDD